MDALDGVRAFVGDAAWTNVLLASTVVLLTRALPHLQALTRHFRLTVKPSRAHTEPGS